MTRKRLKIFMKQIFINQKGKRITSVNPDKERFKTTEINTILNFYKRLK